MKKAILVILAVLVVQVGIARGVTVEPNDEDNEEIHLRFEKLVETFREMGVVESGSASLLEASEASRPVDPGPIRAEATSEDLYKLMNAAQVPRTPTPVTIDRPGTATYLPPGALRYAMESDKPEQIDGMIDLFRKIKHNFTTTNEKFIESVINFRATTAATVPLIKKQLEIAVQAEFDADDQNKDKRVNVTSLLHYLDRAENESIATFSKAVTAHLSQKMISEADLDKMEENLQSATTSDIKKGRKVIAQFSEQIRSAIFNVTHSMQVVERQSAALDMFFLTVAQAEAGARMKKFKAQAAREALAISEKLREKLKVEERKADARRARDNNKRKVGYPGPNTGDLTIGVGNVPAGEIRNPQRKPKAKSS